MLTRRLIVDFAGGELDYFMREPGMVQFEATGQSTNVLRKFLVPNPAIRGIRAMLDVEFEKDKVGIVTALLRSAGRPLTETWTYAWRFYDL